MSSVEIPFAERVAETAHWSDDPPERLEQQEFDLSAFELWHMGNCPDLLEAEDWMDAPRAVAEPAGSR